MVPLGPHVSLLVASFVAFTAGDSTVAVLSWDIFRLIHPILARTPARFGTRETDERARM